MASWHRTKNGNIYVVHGHTGKILQGQPKGGHPSVSAAKTWAVNNTPVSSKREVTKF